MFKNQSISAQVCDHCGKQLKNVPCSVCDGKGYYREWVIFKKDCEMCSGSGRVLRCPDELKHIIEDLKLPPKYETRSIYKNFQKNTSPKPLTTTLKTPLITPKPPVQPQIPPPWHPSYPNPWHPMHPRNPRNQPFSPLNPNSPTNPNNPLNPNNPINRRPFKK